MKFPSTLKRYVVNSVEPLTSQALFIYSKIKTKFQDPVFRQELRETIRDTLYHLPSNTLGLVRGMLQAVHAPAALLKSLESPAGREAVTASAVENSKALVPILAVSNVIQLMPLLDEDRKFLLMTCLLLPYSTRLKVRNAFHTTNISKIFSQENPNNKNFKPCECGSGAHSSADLESIFRYIGELAFAWIAGKLPLVGNVLGFFLNALANAQYLIELKLSLVGMCATHRREIFVNNAMYALGYSLSMLMLANYISSWFKEIPGVKSEYVDVIVLALMTQLFTSIAYLQHGPFAAKSKGKDLLSRDVFFINHAIIDTTLQEMLALVIPQLPNPDFRERYGNYINKVKPVVKLGAWALTDNDLYRLDRWYQVMSLRIFLKVYKDDIEFFLKPAGNVRDKMRKLPPMLADALPDMSYLLANIIYMLWRVNIKDEHLKIIINILSDPSVGKHLLHLKDQLYRVSAETPDKDVVRVQLNGPIIIAEENKNTNPHLVEQPDNTFKIPGEPTLYNSLSIFGGNSAQEQFFTQPKALKVESFENDEWVTLKRRNCVTNNNAINPPKPK